MVEEPAPAEASAEQPAVSPAPAEPVAAAPAADDPTASLERLAGLRDRGLITPEEYEAKKRELLERI
jgi:hypothetical protein